ncbi:MAG: zinc-binding alcohol dehydrogenase [Pseudomonadota bacterium]
MRAVDSAAAPLALWYDGAGSASLQASDAAPPKVGEVRVDVRYSAVSRGTERLVWSGQVPEGEWDRMRAPLQTGDFPGPVKYGYAAVGTVRDGALPAGTAVFALHPHQTAFTVAANMVSPVPDGVPIRRAVLAANMETALNAIWDSGISAGERISVVGCGIVGLLTGWLAARFPGTEVTVVDRNPARARCAAALGCAFALPAGKTAITLEDPLVEIPVNCDHVFHASAHADGLATAIAAAGMEATVTELSWYGASSVVAPLGGAFHSQRLLLGASQVGRIAPRQRARWSHGRRLEKALSLLADERLDTLLTEDIPFMKLPDRLPEIFTDGDMAPCPVVAYPPLDRSPDFAPGQP